METVFSAGTLVISFQYPVVRATNPPVSFTQFEEIIFHPISVFLFYLSKYENTEETDTNEV